MGIALAIEAAVGAAEAGAAAAEAGAAAAGTAEGIAGAAEAGEAIATGAEAGADAGAEAGAEAGAAIESGGEAIAGVVSKLTAAMLKIGKMVAEFLVIDAIFKAAKAILDELTSDPAAKARAQKLAKLVDVLTKSASIMQDIYKWFKEHADDTTTLKGMDVPISGVVSSFMPRLGAAAQVLQTLSTQVAAKNLKKDKITDGEVEALHHGLDTVAQCFQALNEFKKKNEGKVPLLKGVPIDDAKVASIADPLKNV
ncbi:uncharacterized protein LOC135502923 isoform X1 [Lineus longissimus]|uniref:uncharacterized protein LOC135502923 isoform X1 n=1 Tax=Lineus longissimus TaxID=88925 RepID=UPI00315DE4FA